MLIQNDKVVKKPVAAVVPEVSKWTPIVGNALDSSRVMWANPMQKT